MTINDNKFIKTSEVKQDLRRLTDEEKLKLRGMVNEKSWSLDTVIKLAGDGSNPDGYHPSGDKYTPLSHEEIEGTGKIGSSMEDVQKRWDEFKQQIDENLQQMVQECDEKVCECGKLGNGDAANHVTIAIDGIEQSPEKVEEILKGLSGNLDSVLHGLMEPMPVAISKMSQVLPGLEQLEEAANAPEGKGDSAPPPGAPEGGPAKDGNMPTQAPAQEPPAGEVQKKPLTQLTEEIGSDLEQLGQNVGDLIDQVSGGSTILDGQDVEPIEEPGGMPAKASSIQKTAAPPRPSQSREEQKDVLDTNIKAFERLSRGDPTDKVNDADMKRRALDMLRALARTGTADIRLKGLGTKFKNENPQFADEIDKIMAAGWGPTTSYTPQGKPIESEGVSVNPEEQKDLMTSSLSSSIERCERMLGSINKALSSGKAGKVTLTDDHKKALEDVKARVSDVLQRMQAAQQSTDPEQLSLEQLKALYKQMNSAFHDASTGSKTDASTVTDPLIPTAKKYLSLKKKYKELTTRMKGLAGQIRSGEDKIAGLSQKLPAALRNMSVTELTKWAANPKNQTNPDVVNTVREIIKTIEKVNGLKTDSFILPEEQAEAKTVMDNILAQVEDESKVEAEESGQTWTPDLMQSYLVSMVNKYIEGEPGKPGGLDPTSMKELTQDISDFTRSFSQSLSDDELSRLKEERDKNGWSPEEFENQKKNYIQKRNQELRQRSQRNVGDKEKKKTVEMPGELSSLSTKDKQQILNALSRMNAQRKREFITKFRGKVNPATGMVYNEPKDLSPEDALADYQRWVKEKLDKGWTAYSDPDRAIPEWFDNYALRMSYTNTDANLARGREKVPEALKEEAVLSPEGLAKLEQERQQKGWSPAEFERQKKQQAQIERAQRGMEQKRRSKLPVGGDIPSEEGEAKLSPEGEQKLKLEKEQKGWTDEEFEREKKQLAESERAKRMQLKRNQNAIREISDYERGKLPQEKLDKADAELVQIEKMLDRGDSTLALRRLLTIVKSHDAAYDIDRVSDLLGQVKASNPELGDDVAEAQQILERPTIGTGTVPVGPGSTTNVDLSKLTTEEQRQSKYEQEQYAQLDAFIKRQHTKPDPEVLKYIQENYEQQLRQAASEIVAGQPGSVKPEQLALERTKEIVGPGYKKPLPPGKSYPQAPEDIGARAKTTPSLRPEYVQSTGIRETTGKSDQKSDAEVDIVKKQVDRDIKEYSSAIDVELAKPVDQQDQKKIEYYKALITDANNRLQQLEKELDELGTSSIGLTEEQQPPQPMPLSIEEGDAVSVEFKNPSPRTMKRFDELAPGAVDEAVNNTGVLNRFIRSVPNGAALLNVLRDRKLKENQEYGKIKAKIRGVERATDAMVRRMEKLQKVYEQSGGDPTEMLAGTMISMLNDIYQRPMGGSGNIKSPEERQLLNDQIARQRVEDAAKKFHLDQRLDSDRARLSGKSVAEIADPESSSDEKFKDSGLLTFGQSAIERMKFIDGAVLDRSKAINDPNMLIADITKDNKKHSDNIKELNKQLIVARQSGDQQAVADLTQQIETEKRYVIGGVDLILYKKLKELANSGEITDDSGAPVADLGMLMEKLPPSVQDSLIDDSVGEFGDRVIQSVALGQEKESGFSMDVFGALDPEARAKLPGGIPSKMTGYKLSASDFLPGAGIMPGQQVGKPRQSLAPKSEGSVHPLSYQDVVRPELAALIEKGRGRTDMPVSTMTTGTGETTKKVMNLLSRPQWENLVERDEQGNIVNMDKLAEVFASIATAVYGRNADIKKIIGMADAMKNAGRGRKPKKTNIMSPPIKETSGLPTPRKTGPTLSGKPSMDMSRLIGKLPKKGTVMDSRIGSLKKFATTIGRTDGFDALSRYITSIDYNSISDEYKTASNEAIGNMTDKMLYTYLISNPTAKMPSDLAGVKKLVMAAINADKDNAAAMFNLIATSKMKTPSLYKTKDQVKVDDIGDNAGETDIARPAHLNMEVKEIRQSGAYTEMTIQWDSDDAAAERSDQGMEHAVISFVKGLESKKDSIDIGFIGKVVVDSIDIDAGIAEVHFRTKKPGNAPVKITEE